MQRNVRDPNFKSWSESWAWGVQMVTEPSFDFIHLVNMVLHHSPGTFYDIVYVCAYITLSELN